jgi:Zn-finger nucleic acid-binding protein
MRKLNHDMVRPKSAERAIGVDWCGQCKGVWLDGGEAKEVSPTFAGMEQRHIEIVALGVHGGGIRECPRCKKMPYAFKIMDLEIDYCTNCSGIWLDAADAEGRLLEDGGAKIGNNSPYRAVDRATRSEYTNCASCSSKELIGDTYMAGVGLVCRLCHHAILNAVQKRRATDEKVRVARTGPFLAACLFVLELLASNENEYEI